MGAVRGKNKYLIEGGNPKLLKYPIKEGKQFGLTLEYHQGYNHANGSSFRKREKLDLYLISNPRTPQEREKNRRTIELARKIRWEREQEFLELREGYRLRKERKIHFFDFFDNYIENYTKKDIRMIQIARQRFWDFLAKHYPNLRQELFMPDQITQEMMKKFVDYLQTRSVGEGAKSILQRFKKVVRNSLQQGYITKDPCAGVHCVVDDQALVKDFLSQEEMQKLIATHYRHENPEVRKAFIFCLYTGMRWCDVRDLTFDNIDYANKRLRFNQDKTKHHSSKSWVNLPLTDDLLQLVGQPPKYFAKESPVFVLPKNAPQKSLQKWVDFAGIDKHITWHCGRHSFATNLMSNGTHDITIANMLGHSDLRYVQRYARVVDSMKVDAINSLPPLNIEKENSK